MVIVFGICISLYNLPFLNAFTSHGFPESTQDLHISLVVVKAREENATKLLDAIFTIFAYNPWDRLIFPLVPASDRRCSHKCTMARWSMLELRLYGHKGGGYGPQ